MAAYNKVILASEMFIEAHERFLSATRDVDYVISLMLSGAVVGIVAPLLNEQGKPSMHQLLARLSDIAEPDGKRAHEGMFRAVYNGLKHAGNSRKGIVASADLFPKRGSPPRGSRNARGGERRLHQDPRYNRRARSTLAAICDPSPAKRRLCLTGRAGSYLLAGEHWRGR